ncbi:MAG TPA: hypothetical protein VKD69_11220 [Vicinamibacterales bacterium]|nr:hypothetical protein [Vicinamibacterales bacterium]
MVCILLARPDMSLAAAAVLGLQAVSNPWVPHLRPELMLRPLVEEAAERSPSIRALIDRLEASDLIVYVRMRQFSRSDLNGRVALLSAMPARHRYLMIELACGRPDVVTMSTLGHELYHAVEIALEPSIVDARGLIAYDTRAGDRTGDRQGNITFETRGAEQAGVQVRRELFTTPTPTRHTWTLK